MTSQELLLKYINKEKKPRKKGVFWSSDLYAIAKGYLTPANFYETKDIDLYGAENIIFGQMAEDAFKQLLEFNKVKIEFQPRREITIAEGVQLVVKPDFMTENLIIETKFPDAPMDNVIPDKWRYQLESQHRAFGKPVILGIFRKHPFISMVRYNPSPRLWTSIKKKLVEFNEQL